MMTIGERLKDARERLSYSLKYVSKVVGIHRTTIGKYENNECLPSLDIIMKLIILYKEDANYILYGKSKKTLNIENVSKNIVDKIYYILSKENYID